MEKMGIIAMDGGVHIVTAAENKKILNLFVVAVTVWTSLMDIHPENGYSNDQGSESRLESESKSVQCEHVLHNTTIGLEFESKSVPESMSSSVNKPLILSVTGYEWNALHHMLHAISTNAKMHCMMPLLRLQEM